MAIPVLDTVLDLIKGPLERLIPDKNQRQKFEHEVEMSALKAGMAQMEINKLEASHTSVFVAGWRPFIGWVCGFALLWHFILYDLLNWVFLANGGDGAALPELTGTDTLITVLLSMLGLGGLRTFEKVKGVARDK